MTRMLFAGTALAALAAPLAAETTIADTRTAPVRTSTVKGGQPDDIRITSAGKVTLSGGAAGGPAVTVDSDHDLVNEGAITVTNGAAGAAGVLVEAGRNAAITNTGTITVDETYTPTDADNDGDLDGPFAVGSGRTGLRVAGPLTGSVVQGGTILVEGNASAGVALEGGLTGSLRHDGKTTVIGNDSVGVSAQGISGDVRLAGQISVLGEGSVGAHLGGDIGGALVVQGDIVATGYRATTPPSNTTKLDADDLLQGGSALVIEGSVAKGIVFAVPPKDASTTDKDEDKDGIEDSKEGSAKIISYGAAPAVVIGAAERDIAIGAVPGTGNGFGIILEGAVLGDGVYSGVAGNGMVIGGRGGAVTVAGGMLVSGTITAAAKDAAATGLRIGAGATLPELRNSGTISAAASGTAAGNATAVRVDSGASLPLLRNTGTIKAVTAGTGTATAILDASGTLKTVENGGKIIASGGAAGHTIAIDLRAVTGATVKQIAVGAGIAEPVIEGDILLGAGADLLDAADGKITGNVSFGGGADRFQLSGDAVFTGTADFAGSAGVVTLAGGSVFAGRMTNSQNTAVSVTSGILSLDKPTTLGSLDVGAAGVLVATLNTAPGAGTAITVGGTATFVQGSKLRLVLTDITSAVGTYQVLTAGQLVGADKLVSEGTLLPFLYKGALAAVGNTLNVTVSLKSATELGLNTAEAAAFGGLYAALAKDAKVAKLFLGITEEALFQGYLQQTLPDFAGGAFDGLSLGLRTFDRHLLDPEGPLDQVGTLRPVLDFASWNGKKDRGDSAAYDLGGLGFRGGVEYTTGIGAFGVTGTWLWNKHETGFENDVTSTTYEGGVHWRGRFGGLATFARAGYGKASFDGSRLFSGGTGADKVEYIIDRDWSGTVLSAAGGVSLEGGGQFFFFRPSAVIDYVRLKEDGYVETGGGTGLNLTVAERRSSELGLNLGMALGVDLYGMKSRDDFWLRLETEGGWREKLSGTLGSTTAQYNSGTPFTLVPEQRGSGWFARLRGYGGTGFYSLGGEASLEDRDGELGYALRASLRFGW